MPTITIEGAVVKDIETKKTLVKEITDAVEKAYKFPRESYVVYIKENSAENVSVGGKLVSERFDINKKL